VVNQSDQWIRIAALIRPDSVITSADANAIAE